MNTHVPMTAPAPTSNYTAKEKNPNVTLVPMGLQPVILYSIINIGTQDETFDGKPKQLNKLKLTFEFPNHKQLFYVGDTVPKPSVLTMDFTYSISKNNKSGKKSNLLNLIEGIYGPIPEAQYQTWDISQMLGQKFFAQVAHYTKKDQNIGAKITSVSPFNTQMADPNLIVRTNDLYIYAIPMGFDNQYFAKLQYYDRENIKKSHEAKAHLAAGGWFAKLDEHGNVVKDDGSYSAASAPAQPVATLIMTNPAIPYEAWKAQGWTDEALIEKGHARREAPVQAAPPAQIQQPVQPQVPAMQQAPQVPQVPAIPKPITGVVMNDPNADYNAFVSQGWTDDLLVQHGYATRPAPVAPPVPVTPSIPQAPLVPAVPSAPMAPQAPIVQPNPASLFNQTPAAPVQQMAPPAQAEVPMPGQPVLPQNTFEVPSPSSFDNGDEPDDLPF